MAPWQSTPGFNCQCYRNKKKEKTLRVGHGGCVPDPCHTEAKAGGLLEPRMTDWDSILKKRKNFVPKSRETQACSLTLTTKSTMNDKLHSEPTHQAPPRTFSPLHRRGLYSLCSISSTPCRAFWWWI